MKPETIESYQAVQNRRGEWRNFDRCFHLLERDFGIVLAVEERPTISIYLETMDTYAYCDENDPNLLWLPPPVPRRPGDDGRNLWAWVNWDKYELAVGTGGKVSVVPRHREYLPFRVCTLPEALLRAVGEKEG